MMFVWQYSCKCFHGICYINITSLHYSDDDELLVPSVMKAEMLNEICPDVSGPDIEQALDVSNGDIYAAAHHLLGTNYQLTCSVPQL